MSDDLDAKEDAAQDIANRAMAYSRKFGQPSPEPLANIFNDHKRRQARALLIAALIKLHGTSNREEVKILHALRNLDHIHCDRHDALAEQWQIIEDTARDSARDEMEYL